MRSSQSAMSQPEQPPHPPGMEVDGGDDDLEGDQAEDGEQPGEERGLDLLDGQGGDVGDEDGHHQLRGLQFPQLPLAHEADPKDDDDIKDQGAEKCDQQQDASFQIAG